MTDNNISGTIPNLELEPLTSKLRSEDNRNMKITRNFQWIMWILAPLYLGFFLINPDGEMKLADRLMGLFDGLAFLIFAIYFRKYYKEYKTVDYALPTLEMLKKAAHRYKLFHKFTLVVLIPVILVGAGTTSSLYNNFPNVSPLKSILLISGSYIALMAVSASIGVLIWYKRQKPLRDKALELINELEK